jgi:predicted HicB family RNase H-like nuclease
LEFPSLSFLAGSHVEALKGISEIVDEIVFDMQRNNEEVPVALAEKHFSGKFQVRIPPEQHRKLAIKAAEMGVSLNRYISSKLIE